ncbi:MAG: glycosyltransferase family 39 protein [Acidobacteria bacterium]|nr:glycosyltransferase family 39 protein [Acidobacteriota bacterium]
MPLGKSTDRAVQMGTLAGITLLGGALRVYDLGAKSYWVDELISLCHARAIQDVSSFLMAHCGNAHPPLYFLILKGWLVFGEGEFATRLLSVIFATAAILAAFLLGRELLDPRTGLLTSFLMAVSPFLLQYDREVRMYSLLTLLTLLSFYWFIKALRTGRGVYWAFYTALSAVSLCVHYHALLVLASEWAFFFAGFKAHRHLIRNAALSQIAIAAVGVWWLPALRFQIQHPALFTIGSPDKFPVFTLAWLAKPLYVLYAFSLGQTLLPWNPAAIAGSLLIAVLALIGARRLWQANRQAFLFIGLSLVVSFLMAAWVSDTMPRYLVFLAPLYYFVVARGLLAAPRRDVQAGVLCLFLIPVSLSDSNYYRNREFHILAQADPWRQVSEHIHLNARPMDCVVAIGAAMPLGHYLDHFQGFTLPTYDVEFQKIQPCMDADKTRRLWVVTSDSNLAPVSDQARAWAGERYRLLDEKKFFEDRDAAAKARFFRKNFLRYRIIVSLYGSS